MLRGTSLCDAGGHFVFFSPEAGRILGFGAMHMGSAEWSLAYGCYRPDMVTPYPPQELPLARAMRGEEALHELIFIRNLLRPAGLWIDAGATPLRDTSGRSRAAVVLVSDVSVPEHLLRNEAAVDASVTPGRDPSDPGESRHDLVSERFARFRTMYDQLARAVEQTGDSILITDKRAAHAFTGGAPQMDDIMSLVCKPSRPNSRIVAHLRR